ncbi:MAG: glycosyl transferase group 1 [Hyphomicrobiales bacterium]|nr:glycosyl transferase group 1 [Hyphomicrobiales bacterium]
MLRAPVTSSYRVLMTLDAVGGVWRYAVDLAHALAHDGVAVKLVGFGPRPSASDAAHVQVDLTWEDLPLDWAPGGPEALGAARQRLLAHADAFGADVLHLNALALAHEDLGAFAQVTVGHSCLATWWRAMREGAEPDAWRPHQAANRNGYHAADVVVAPSAAHARAMQEAYGERPGLRTIHNGASAPERDNARERFVLAAARWWDEAKNARTLDAAAAQARWPVVMAGALEGPDGGRAAISHAQAPGALSAEALAAQMQRASIFASPSLYEPFGLAALEAARAGAALVLADIPTYREVWGDAARYASPRDPAEFARALNALIDDPGLRAELSARAAKRARRYTLARQAQRTLEAYEAATRMHRGGVRAQPRSSTMAAV